MTLFHAGIAASVMCIILGVCDFVRMASASELVPVTSRMQCRHECYKEESLCMDACPSGECKRWCREQRKACFEQCEEEDG